MTDPSQALAWLKALDEGATKGPWVGGNGGLWADINGEGNSMSDVADFVTPSNAALIAHMRNVLPQLIGVVSEAVPDVLAASVGNEYSCTVPTATLKALHTALTALAAAVEKEKG